MEVLKIDHDSAANNRARQNRQALQAGALQAVTRYERRQDAIAAIDSRFVAAQREHQANAHTRAYKVASLDRLSANWPVTHISINRELRQSLRAMRNRIRILAQNDDYIKRFLDLEMNNGPGWEGYTPLLSMSDWDPTSDDPLPGRDLKILKMVEDAWKEWCRSEHCSISGKMSHVDQARLFRRTRKRDGEVLVRRVIADNPFGYALQFIDVAWLDEYYNEVLPNGNRVIMSVEMDQFGKPLAYWLTMPASEYLFSARPAGAPFRERVEASRFIHAFIVLDGDDQARGVPEPHTAALTLKVLDEFDYADLVGSYVEQCQLPYLVPPSNADLESVIKGAVSAGSQDPTAPQIPHPIERQVEPAIQTILPPGWDVKNFTPSHPARDGEAFRRSMLRRAAAGFSKAYFSLTGDLSDVNYSTAKAGQLEERAGYRYDQNFDIEHFERVVFSGPGPNFLQQAWLAGKITCEYRDLQRIRALWRPRGWPSMEPLKEIQATILAINNFLDSHIDYSAENGEKWEEIVLKIHRAEKLIKKLGLKQAAPAVTGDGTAQKKTDDTPAGEAEEEEETETGKEDDDDGTNRTLPEFQLLPPKPNGKRESERPAVAGR